MNQWITFDPEILGGKPHIRGTRLSVEFIMELFASGASHAEVLEAYPQVTLEALEAVLRYAAKAVTNENFLRVEIPA